MRSLHINLILKSLKIAAVLFLIFPKINAFGAVSGFVDSKQVNQNIPMAIAFNPSGTKMFVVGMSQNKIFEFDLTTGFDVSTATKNSNECSFIGLGDDVVDIDFNSDGTKLFLVDQHQGGNDETIEEFDLSTAYDVSSCTHVEEHFKGDFVGSVGIEFDSSGTKLFIYHTAGTDSIKQYSLSSPYNLSNPTLQKQSTGTSDKTFQTIESQPSGFTFSSDGSKMFITGKNKDKVQEFNLSTPFDLSSVSRTNGYDISGQIDAVGGVSFSADGLKMFVLDSDNDAANKDVNEYDLTCGFGVIKCIDPTANKDDVASIETQSETTKKLIQHTTYPVINRMEWLRRNSTRANLTNQNIKFQFNNAIMSSLSESLIPLYFSNDGNSQSNLKNSNWSFWSEGTISIGSTGDTNQSSSKSISTSAITLGADKKGEDNIMRGIALRFGTDDVDIGDLGSALDMSSFSLTFYESKPKGEQRFTDNLIGVSFLNSSLINNSGSASTDGDRYGEQLYGSLSLRDTFSKNQLNFTPKLKINYGVTHLGAYTETGSTGLNLKYDDQYIGNLTSSVATSLDNTYDFEVGSFIPYFDFEYYADMSPSSQQKFSYVSNGESFTLKNINNATHNFVSGIGFDFISENGLTFMTKYTRDQAENSKNDSFVIALDYRGSQRSSYAMSIQDTTAKLSHDKTLDGFKIDIDSHYDFFKDNPEYGVYLKISNIN
jgi:sugar lactone lactonase YvrE